MDSPEDEGNLFDPNKGRFDVANAEQVLGMTEDDKQHLQMVVAVDLLCAHAGIVDAAIDAAYSIRIRSQLSEAADNLRSLVGDDDDNA